VKATLTKNSKYMDWIIREHTEVELHDNSIKMEVGFPQGVKKASHSHPAGTTTKMLFQRARFKFVISLWSLLMATS
jgi:hypothetical protein